MFAAIDNWLFLILVGIAALFRLLSKAAGSKSDDDVPDESTFPPPDPNIPRQPARSSEEEKIRKFLEALGQPAASKPPPPVAPRTHLAPRPVAPVQPPRTLPVPAPRTRRIEPRPTVNIPPSESAVPGDWLRKLNVPEPVSEPVSETLTVPPPLPGEPRRPTVVTMKGVTESAIEPYAVGVSPELKTGVEVVALLRSAAGARTGMILREILGAPRGVRPLEDLPGTA